MSHASYGGCSDGMRLTPALSTDSRLTLQNATTLGGGYVELT
jgi:hypothetical protein